MPAKKKPSTPTAATKTSQRTARKSAAPVPAPPPDAPRQKRPYNRSMKPGAVAERTRRSAVAGMNKRIKKAIHQATPPWMRGAREKGVAITPSALRNLGAWLSTFAEAAAFLGISVTTLSNRLREHPELRAAWDEGHELGKGTLRRRQLEVAFSDTPQAATLLVHLGKTILGQRDRVEHTGGGGGPIRYNHIRRTIVDPKLPEGEQEIDVTRYGPEGPAEPETRH